jgi:hypothetical protein
MRERFVLAVLATVLAAASSMGVASQKPVRSNELLPDYFTRITEPDELWAASDLIIEGTIESSRPHDERSGAPPFTVFGIRVLAVYKPHAAVVVPGGLIELMQVGGDRDQGSYIQRTRAQGFSLLTVNSQYILFLKELKDTAGFYSATNGPTGVFRIVGASIHTESETSVAAGLQAKNLAGLRGWLNAKRGAQ